jgi:hypothetical protein
MPARRSERSAAETMHLLMPLHFFYEKDGRPMPPLEFVQPAAIPGNERELLVHDHDMTSTLEEYHQSPIDLQVVKREASDDYLMRLVVLTKRELPVPVEFGAIGIRLDVFEPSLRAEVLAGQKPLGGLLDQHRFGFVSAPSAFFKITADRFIADLLSEPDETILWGRCNSLSTAEGEVFADIVEILPPALRPVPASVHRNGGPLRG